MENTVLVHHGTKGMRWGVRRFQNKDGSLTAAGKKRRSIGETIHDYKVASKKKASIEKARAAKIKKKRDEERQQKIDAKREKLIKKGKIKTKDMTDEEIKKRTERLEAEKRLKQLEGETEVKGALKRFGGTLVKKVLTPAAIASGEKFMRNALDKVGDDILKSYEEQQNSLNPKYQQEKRIEKLKRDFTEKEFKKKIKDLDKPEKSVADEIKEIEDAYKLLLAKDENFQALKRQAQEAEYINKINKAKKGDTSDDNSNKDSDD